MAYGPRKDYEVILNGVLIGYVETTGDIEKDQQIVMDFIKQKGLYVEPSEVKTMFRCIAPGGLDSALGVS
jgi:hypothetical protein